MQSSGTVSTFDKPLDLAEANRRAERSLRADWKFMPRSIDSTPKLSVSQEQLAYIVPAPGSNQPPCAFKHEFCQYLDKAITLKVDLKAVGHS